MLRSHHGIYNGSEVVDVWEGLDTQDDIVICSFLQDGCVFWRSNDCVDQKGSASTIEMEHGGASGENIPCRGLKRSLPNVPDLKEIPYCDTCSKPFFHTSVTSQALVACSLHDRKADTAFPPTEHTFIISSLSSMLRAYYGRMCRSCPNSENPN